jgi:hypothetical protein
LVIILAFPHTPPMAFELWYNNVSLENKLARTAADMQPPRRRSATGPPVRAVSKNPAKLYIQRADRTLAAELVAMRQGVVDSRKPPTRKQRKRVLESLRRLPLLERARRLDEAAKLRKLSSKRVSAFEQFTLFTTAHEYRNTPSVTAPLVSAYLAWCVIDKGNASHALEDTLSNLRVAAKAVGTWDVSAAEEDQIKDHIAYLQHIAPSAPKERVQVELKAIARTCRRLRQEGTLKSTQKLAAITTGIGIHARGTEMGGDRGMRWDDVRVDGRGLGFTAYLSKTTTNSLQPRARAFPHMPRGAPHLEDICPARALSEYRAALGANGTPPLPTDRIWKSVDSKDYGRTLTVKEVTAMMKAELTKEGVPEAALDSHWQRYTGAEILTIHLRMDPTEGDMMGDFAPCKAGERRTRNLKTKTYLRPATKTRDQLMDIAAKFTRKAGAPTCCSEDGGGMGDGGDTEMTGPVGGEGRGPVKGTTTRNHYPIRRFM